MNQAYSEHGQPPRHTIQRVTARASLDDPAPELERARLAADDGDSSWQRWLDDFDCGEATIARLEVTVEVERGLSGYDAVEIQNRGLWIELRADPPLVEAQIAELTAKDFGALERMLRERGLYVREERLHEMYVHVELAGDLRAVLLTAPMAGEQPSERTPPASRIGDTPP